MAKSAHNDVLDGSLNIVKNNATRICVCSAEPTTYAEATTTYDGGASKYKLAIKTITSADFTGPADGDVSGRKLTSNAHTAVTIDATADATHIALCDSGTSKLLYVTTATTQTLTAAGTVNIPAWKIELADPA
jgi:hypothetical protein